MNRDWTEEKIAALIDGSLEDEQEAEALRRVLERDPEAQAYADALRQSNDLLREAFETPEDEETPAAIKAAIFGKPGKVETLRPKSTPSIWMPTAFAASLALAIGLAAGSLLFDQSAAPVIAKLGNAPLDGPLHAALESLPSGAVSPEGVQPMISFIDGEGRPCREFDVMRELPDELEFGIACRNPAGRWHVEIVVTAPVTEPGPEGYAPASGAGGDALNAMLDALGAGPALSPEEETELMLDEWRGTR